MHRVFLRLTLPLCLSLLAACAGHRPPPPEPGADIGLYLQNAYRPAAMPVNGWQAQWTLGDDAVDVTWLAPVQPQGAPVILYLPGLGEDSNGGAAWRKAWAEAGYAVLSLQAPRDGHSIYSSKQAQVGAFYALAQRGYGAEALQRRIALVERTLAEARRRPELAGVDWTRLSVAGFDLGAQTAAALAGERDAGSPQAVAWRPQAAVLLSPYVDSQADPQRFSHIAAPVLAVTGARDEDPFGWVMPPGRRQQLWQGIRVAGSYQLLAGQASHALIAGETPGARPHGDDEDEPDRRPPRGEGGPGGGGMGAGPGGPPGGGERVFISRAGHGQNMDERFDPRQAAAIQAVSLAFLDARVRRLPAAQAWLDQRAGAWLPPDNQLQRRP